MPINYDDTKRQSSGALPKWSSIREEQKNLEEILNQDNHKTQDMFKRCAGVCMNQMTAKAGIKKHGQTAITAILKDFGQLNDRRTFKPIFKHTLTR